LVQFDNGKLVAYDVETNAWTDIGVVAEPVEVTSEGQTQTLVPPFLIGYVEETDQLAFLGFDGAPFQDRGKLIDPRTGATTGLDDPPNGVVGGFGSFRYAYGGETAYALTGTELTICRLEPATTSWACSSHPPPGEPGINQVPSAMVFDPITNRLVIINDWCCVWPGGMTTNDVWAIDLDTGQTIELLSATEQTFHDPDD
jgi:hypothetical protein